MDPERDPFIRKIELVSKVLPRVDQHALELTVWQKRQADAIVRGHGETHGNKLKIEHIQPINVRAHVRIDGGADRRIDAGALELTAGLILLATM